MISCIVLAGGKGSRMGYVNKALLKKDDKYFIEILLKNIKHFKEIDEIIISCNSRELDFLNLPVYPDEINDIGPMGGFYSTLPKIKNDFALIVPCDLPFLGKEIIKKLLEVSPRENFDIIVPMINGHVDYLVGLYSKFIFSSIESLISKKTYKIAELTKNNKTKYVYLEETYLNFLKNINTLEHLEEIL